MTVRVDGVDRIHLTGLGGATTSNARYLRVGIIVYSGWTTADAVRVYHGAVALGRSAWLGPAGGRSAS